MNHSLRSIPLSFALLSPRADAPPPRPREMRLCEWCGVPCTGRDENGDPACPLHASEAATEAAPKVAHPVDEKPRDIHREVHNFVVGEFRSFGAIV